MDESQPDVPVFFYAYRDESALWLAASGARFAHQQRVPDGWTSADAAGLPIHPGLVRYDEVVEEGVIDYASRVTVERTQGGFSPEVKVICAALKKCGMFVADNSGDLFISGAPDPRWNDDNLADLEQIEATALEVVYTGEIVSD